jgi:KDO2-lipid IV(A) lauroyltransferase
LIAAPPALASYWAPRYWPTWVLVLWLRLTAALPWRTAIRLHRWLGRVAGVLLSSRRRIVRRNLELCFADLDARQIEALTARHFENLGVFVAETAMAWFADPARRAHRFRIEGSEHLQAALARGKGVLLYAGHFTSLEICIPVIKQLVPLFAFVFRKRHNPLLDEFQSRCRERAAHVALVNDDIRAVLRLLEENAAVVHIPDQARIEGGELLPFFGEPAMTSTATSRLARLSGAVIIPLFFRRLPGDGGYLLRFHAPLEGLPSDDVTRDTVRLIGVLEDFVRECPEQYLWAHRKFKDRPGNLPDVYA